MDLHTKIELKKEPHNPIDYDSKILFLGSCFSENIGQKFRYYKFQTLVNPFGILFHPIAIENFVTRAINKTYYEKNELVNINEYWVSLDAHSRLRESTEVELLRSLNRQIDMTHQQLRESTHVIITLGTSWVYKYLETDKIVANCHKLPQKKFLKELLNPKEVEKSLQATISLIKSINQDVSILFTVSPIRHLKDGIVESNRSKAHLITAIHNLINPSFKSYYFPAYEIMMDELRDYRFYKADMTHPSEMAITYIWNRFKDIWLTSKTKEILKRVEAIQRQKFHKPFNPDSEAHKLFLQKLEQQIADFQAEYPNIVL